MKIKSFDLEPDYNQDVTEAFNNKIFHNKLHNNSNYRNLRISTIGARCVKPLFVHEQWFKIGKHLNYFLINCDQDVNHYIILN